jgi:hypothetical protein
MERNALKPANAERREAVLMLKQPEVALDRATATAQLAPALRLTGQEGLPRVTLCRRGRNSIAPAITRPRSSRCNGLQHLRDAVGLLERKATPEELDAYKSFVLSLADKVANAHREGGSAEAESEAERAAIGEIAAALGATNT